MITNYEEVCIRRTVTWEDPITLKQVQRKRKFIQKLAPWNTQADGTIKDKSDIYVELKIKADKWADKVNKEMNAVSSEPEDKGLLWR